MKQQRKRLPWIGLVGVLIALPLTGHTWEKETDDDGVTIYSRATKDSDIDTLRGVIELPHQTDFVAAMLADTESYHAFMPDLAEVVVLRTKKQDDRSIAYVYQRLDLSAIDDRDFIVRGETSYRETDKGTVWTTRFAAANDVGPAPIDDVVRVAVLKGRWTAEPIDGGEATRLTWVRHIEMGGSTPAWLVNSGSRDSLEEMLLKFREYCKKKSQ